MCGVLKVYLRRAAYAAINEPGTVTLPADMLRCSPARYGGVSYYMAEVTPLLMESLRKSLGKLHDPDQISLVYTALAMLPSSLDYPESASPKAASISGSRLPEPSIGELPG